MNMCKSTTEVYGNIWFKQMEFKKTGDIKEGHVHNHDHITFLTNGTIELFSIDYKDKEKVGETSLGIFSAPEYIKVPKGVAHTVIAMEDNTMAYCIEAVRDGDEVVTTHFDDPKWEETNIKDIVDISYN